MSLATVKQLLLGKPRGRSRLRVTRGGSYGAIADVESPSNSTKDSTATISSYKTDTERQVTSSSPQKWKPSARMISDAIIGLSDGLTVPFALTAGLSSLDDTRIVVLGGLAELVAGAISMGLGGFIGAKSEAESYQATLSATSEMVMAEPKEVTAQVSEVFRPYGLSSSESDSIAKRLLENTDETVDFLMRFHHQICEPDTKRPLESAVTIGMGYFVGGFIPLLPYFFVQRREVMLALIWSIGIMAIALFAFGWVKTGVVRGWTGRENVVAATKGGLQMVLVGGVAAGAAVGLVRAINGG